MYKNFSPEALGVSGRQSELIELALTYGFRGLDIDMADFAKRVQHRGAEHARRYIESAQDRLKIGGWELPVHMAADEATFKKDLEQLAKVAEAAASIGATVSYSTVQPACDDLPYHENFEQHRQRYTMVADVLAPHGIKLGLNFVAPAALRAGATHSFIHQAEVLLLLIRTIGHANVGLMLDLWHWHVAKASLDQLNDVKGEQIVAVRLADCPADADLDLVGDKQRMLPGTGGAIDSVAALLLLETKGFEGPVAPYPHPSALHGRTRDAICKGAGEAIESVFRAAGLSKAVVRPAPISPPPFAGASR